LTRKPLRTMWMILFRHVSISYSQMLIQKRPFCSWKCKIDEIWISSLSLIYPRQFGCVKTTQFCGSIIEQIYQRHFEHFGWFQRAEWEKHSCFRDGTILRNPIEVLMVVIDQTTPFALLTYYTQSAPFLSFWEFRSLWVKRINRPNNNLQTLAYNADCINDSAIIDINQY
jgi:hypothetical protein